MCAIIGAYLENPSEQDFLQLEKVFVESSIRGLHATGLSWLRDNHINTFITKDSIEKFFKSFALKNTINEDGNLYLIGHCRYSTSDLKYNQPLYNENFAIVHNGVVTQEMPEDWERLYGYKCVTRNDSELILHTLEAKKSPLVEFADASMAVVELHKNKRIRFYRNGKRPLYFTSIGNGRIITSTKDIAVRASLSNPKEATMNRYTVVGKDVFYIEDVFVNDAKDLQHV